MKSSTEPLALEIANAYRSILIANGSTQVFNSLVDDISAAIAEEREACAEIAEKTKIIGAMGVVLCRGDTIADVIRKRGEP